jgi:hypothetical protein
MPALMGETAVDLSLAWVERAPDDDYAKNALLAALNAGATGIQLRQAWLNYRANAAASVVRIGNEEQQ